MATFRSGVKILGQVSKPKVNGQASFRSRSCDKKALFNIQQRQESAFVAQDPCDESLKKVRRSSSWLSIFSRNRSPDSIDEERTSKKENESWFNYFDRKPLQETSSEATVKSHNEEYMLKDKKTAEEDVVTIHNDATRECISSSISKGGVCQFHKGIMSPRSAIIQPLGREISLNCGRSGFHSIPSNSYTKDKMIKSTKNVATTQQSADVNYRSMVTQNPESCSYTAPDVQNLLMTSLSKSSSDCINPYSFINNEAKRSKPERVLRIKPSNTDSESQNQQLHSSNSNLKSTLNVISTVKQKEKIKQDNIPQIKPQTQPSVSNTNVHKAEGKILHSESSSISSITNNRLQKEREAFLKTKAIISMKAEVSNQNNKISMGKNVLQSNTSQTKKYDLLKCKPLKLNIKPKEKARVHITNPYIPESKIKTQKSKYISDSPLIKQKSHPTQFIVHPTMIANSAIPLRLSHGTASVSEKHQTPFEESKIYQNDLKGPVNTFSCLLKKIDETTEHLHIQNLRNKQATLKKPNIDHNLKHELLMKQDHFIGMSEAAKIESEEASSDPQPNTEIKTCMKLNADTELNSQATMEHVQTKQYDYNKIMATECTRKPNDAVSADTNTAEEIMIEKKHALNEDLNENMRSKFGMHMPYFKNQNNILTFKRGKNNKNKNETLNLSKQNSKKSTIWTTSPKLSKQREEYVNEMCESDSDKMHASEISKASPRSAVEEESSQQKSDVASEIPKPLDLKVTEDSNIKSDKNISTECDASMDEIEKFEKNPEEVPELTLQADQGNEDNIEMHQDAQLETPKPSIKKHRYFPNYFAKRSLSGYTDPPTFGEKPELSCCPGKEKGSSKAKCKKLSATEEKQSKKTCVKVSDPNCPPAKSTLCVPPSPSDECCKKMPPAPSYSECLKNPIPPKPYTECDLTPDLECPGVKKTKNYDGCNQQPPEDVCARAEKKKKSLEDALSSEGKSCEEEKPCPEPYPYNKGQKTMGYSKPPLKCLSRKFSSFQNYAPNRFYCTSENENLLLCNRGAQSTPQHCSSPYMLLLSSLYHNKMECKGGSPSQAPSSDKPCKKASDKQDTKQKKATCVKITVPGCEVPKSTLCVPPVPSDKCCKVLAPRPSFSECVRSVEIPPRRFTECDPTKDLECPSKKTKNYDGCNPIKKADNPCGSAETKRKPPPVKDNACVKEDECSTEGKKAYSGFSKTWIKCPSMNPTATHFFQRRHFSSTSDRCIMKTYSSSALDSRSLLTEEMAYTPFLVVQHMRKDTQQQPIHERNTQKETKGEE